MGLWWVGGWMDETLAPVVSWLIGIKIVVVVSGVVGKLIDYLPTYPGTLGVPYVHILRHKLIMQFEQSHVECGAQQPTTAGRCQPRKI